MTNVPSFAEHSSLTCCNRLPPAHVHFQVVLSSSLCTLEPLHFSYSLFELQLTFAPAYTSHYQSSLHFNPAVQLHLEVVDLAAFSNNCYFLTLRTRLPVTIMDLEPTVTRILSRAILPRRVDQYGCERDADGNFINLNSPDCHAPFWITPVRLALPP